MTTTFVQYEGDGSNPSFVIPFPYLSPDHIRVRVGAFPCVLGAHYDITGPSTLTFRPQFVPPNESVIELRRVTPSGPLVVYVDGAMLTSDDLNVATKQALYITEEIRDYYEGRLEAGFSRLTNGTYSSAEEAINAAVQGVLDSELLADLQSRIGEINSLGETGVTHAAQIATLNDAIDELAGVFDPEEYAAIVEAETTARVTADSALAATIALIGAVGGGGTSFVLDLSKVQVGGGEALGTRLSGISTSLAANSAAIASEASARSTADSANAAATTALESIVNGHTASIGSISTTQSTHASALASQASLMTTLQSTLAGNTALLSTTATVVNGLAAQWMVKTDVNGRVAGFGLYNTGATSEFIVLADKFAIVNPAAPGGTPVVPFVVSGGVVHMQNVVIGNAVIDNAAITTAKIQNLAVSGAKVADAAIDTVKVAVDAISTLAAAEYEWAGTPHDSNLSTSFAYVPEAIITLNLGSLAGTKRVRLDWSFVAARDGGDDDNLEIQFFDTTLGAQVGARAYDVQIFSGRRMYHLSRTFEVTGTGSRQYRIRWRRTSNDGSPYVYASSFTGQVFKR